MHHSVKSDDLSQQPFLPEVSDDPATDGDWIGCAPPSGWRTQVGVT
jgi:hypothetical protein